MRARTKSAVHRAREAVGVGRRRVPRYSCRRSRHALTQAQLFAVLILRQCLQTDYRGVVPRLAEWRAVRQTLGLRQVPHDSTLCYAERRLLAAAEQGAPCGAPSTSAARAPSAPASSGAPPSLRSTPRGARCGTSVSTSGSAAPATTRATPTSSTRGRTSRRSPTRPRICSSARCPAPAPRTIRPIARPRCAKPPRSSPSTRCSAPRPTTPRRITSAAAPPGGSRTG
jgi:hypothetical protein